MPPDRRFIEGGTETVLQFEDGFLEVARKLYGGILEIKEEYSSPQNEQAAEQKPTPKADTTTPA